MKKSVFLGVILSALALPSMASAACGQMKGSFVVSCENNVTVYRHKALNLRSVGLTKAQTQMKIAEQQQATARQKIAADRATAQEQAALKSRQLDNEYARDARKANSRYDRYDRGYGRYNRYGYRRGFATFTPRGGRRGARRGVRAAKH